MLGTGPARAYKRRMKLAALAPLLLAACAAPLAEPASPQDTFLARLGALCGRAFEGRVVADTPSASPDFAGKRLVMYVRDCSADEVRIPFHVGEDRSRTWVVTRTPGGLRLKHDHRHEDGTEDKLSRYGGHTTAPGTFQRQEFPADSFSKELFLKEGNAASVANVWALEAGGSAAFAYELRRPGRFFRVEFR